MMRVWRTWLSPSGVTDDASVCSLTRAVACRAGQSMARDRRRAIEHWALSIGHWALSAYPPPGTRRIGISSIGPSRPDSSSGQPEASNGSQRMFNEKL